jgi:hypothetical protein
MASQVDQMLEIYGAAQLEQSFGVTVVLARGGLESAPFTATWENDTEEIGDHEGFLTKRQMRVFVFPASKALLGGDTVEPRAGDRLRLTEVGQAVEYEIAPLGTLSAVEATAGGYRWMVRTRQVAT